MHGANRAQLLIIDQPTVERLLPMEQCIPLMSDALIALARGEVVLPLRPLLRLPRGRGILGMMPAYVEAPRALGIKLITVFPTNHGTEFDSHQGAVLLFEPEYGALIALLDASSITAIRTAAVSGLATQLLARAGASDLCILGSGVQARSHLAAMLLVRPIERVRIWSRSADHARAFATAATQRHGITVDVMQTAQDAAAGADIICSVTASSEPILHGEWIARGAHVNAVGASTPNARELDTAAVRGATLFVDCRESALNEAGDFLIPKREGAISDDHIRGELGEVLLERIPGRQSHDEITLFKSLGIAVEDVVAAHHIYQRATADGAGTRIALGGRRDAAP